MEFQPDIVHGHDWQTGPLMAYLNLLYRQDRIFQEERRVCFLDSQHGGIKGCVLGRSVPAALGLPPHGFLLAQVRGVLRAGQLFENGVGLRRRAQHGQPHVCAGNQLLIRSSAAGSTAFCANAQADFQGILNGIDVLVLGSGERSATAHELQP